MTHRHKVENTTDAHMHKYRDAPHATHEVHTRGTHRHKETRVHPEAFALDKLFKNVDIAGSQGQYVVFKFANMNFHFIEPPGLTRCAVTGAASWKRHD